MDYYRILITYSETGGGHRCAAEAIKTAIDEIVQSTADAPNIEVFAEAIVENSNLLNRSFVELYNYLLRYHQAWVKYYIGWIEMFKPNDNWLGYRLCCVAVKASLQRIEPAIVISVHPMVNHYTARALKDMGMAETTRFVIVVTDPNANLWSGWACSDADLTFAPNDLARDRLIELGVESSRIPTLGMPIEPEFTRRAKVGRHELLFELKLDPERFTILLSAGWAGSEAIRDIYQALQQVKKPIQVIILCGHNDKLFAIMNEEKEGSVLPTVVLAFTESLSSLMSAGDLLVTKGGGLTTFEAIARRLPMALDLRTEAMPQESGTVKMLIEAQLAKPIHEPRDIVDIVESLERVYDREARALPTAHNLDCVDAIYDIAETILDLLPRKPESNVLVSNIVGV